MSQFGPMQCNNEHGTMGVPQRESDKMLFLLQKL
jgi:hypothetical protein